MRIHAQYASVECAIGRRRSRRIASVLGRLRMAMARPPGVARQAARVILPFAEAPSVTAQALCRWRLRRPQHLRCQMAKAGSAGVVTPQRANPSGC